MPQIEKNANHQIVKGFVSYAHEDDETDDGRIRALIQDIQNAYSALTAKEIHIFTDVNDLGWGVDWESEINDSLAQVDFFIPIITPKYINSTNCRKEFEAIRERLDNQDATVLLFPIIYIPIREEDEVLSHSDILKKVKSSHYKDWKDLRFSERTSKEYRIAVNGCAEEIIEINKKFALTRMKYDLNASLEISTKLSAVARINSNEEDYGELELLSEGADAMEEFAPVLDSITKDMLEMSEFINQIELEVNAPTQERNIFKHRLILMNKLANQLQPIGTRLISKGETLTTLSSQADVLVRKLIVQEVEEGNEEAKQAKREFRLAVEEMSATSSTSAESIDVLLGQFTEIEKQSREIRQPLMDIRYGLTLVKQTNEIIQGWMELVRQTN